MKLRRIFYNLKPAIPRGLQIFLRRKIARYKRKKYSQIWPIDPTCKNPPDGWAGWPDGKKFALLLCHDVDTKKGYESCLKLAEIEEDLGFKSYFNFVPERYHSSRSVLEELRRRGFGIGVHGLKHDGKLFGSRKIFNQRAVKINDYLKKWNTRGFSSPSMHHNTDWMHALNITYSTTTFDTDPFEPQSDAIGSIFPVWVPNGNKQQGYLELPYTLPQDHLLFIILQKTCIDILKMKLQWIAEHGGMALLNTHTDYMNFGSPKLDNEEYPFSYYLDFLNHLKNKYYGQYWNILPNEMVRFWKKSVI